MSIRPDRSTGLFPCGLLLLGGLSQHPDVSAADIYKWTDDSGRTHYGDHPPDDQSIRVGITNAPRSDGRLEQRLDDQQRLLEVIAEERQRQKQAAADLKGAGEKRAASCTSARNILAAMQNSRYLYAKTADPYNPEILTEAETSTALSKAADEVVQRCGKPSKP